MKLFIDLRKLSYKPSGIGIYTYNLVKGLINNTDIELVGITDIIQSTQLQELSKKINIFAYGKRVDNNIDVFKYFLFIEKILKKYNAQLFYEPNFIIPFNIKRILPNLKCIISIHDVIPVTHKYHSLFYRTYFIFFLYKSLRYIDKIVYTSKNCREEAEKIFKKINKIDSSIVYPIFNYNNSTFISDYKYFLYIGNIERRKGVDILLEAYKIYIENGGENKLVICGNIYDTDLKRYIDEVIGELGSRVKYLGYVSELKRLELISNCSAFVYPSFCEGFGMPPMEAVSLNKPIIISNISIFREVYGDCANYYNIYKDEKETINSLAYSLSNFNSIDKNKVFNLVKKYCEKDNVNTFINLINRED